MLEFLLQFLKAPLQTGAVVPSGRSLARAMVAPIDFRTAKSIVELGPGTGVVTQELLRRMGKNCRLTVIELNSAFCEKLECISDARLKVIHGRAEDLAKYVSEVDYVVSGLPLVSFPRKEHEMVLRAIHKVTRQAYIQFHYSLLGESFLRREFGSFSKRRVLANIPPAIVYVVNSEELRKSPHIFSSQQKRVF